MTTVPATGAQAVQHPGGDERFKEIDRRLEGLKYEKNALLEVLNTAQDLFGYLSEDLLRYISRQMAVPLSRVYSVATFYHRFTLRPTGARHCLVCTDPICAAAGAGDVLAAFRGCAETRAEGEITAASASCLGLCDQAPAALVSGAAYVDLKASSVDAVFTGEARRARLQVTGEPRVMTRLIGKLKPTDLDAHRAEGAFAALQKALTEMTPEAVIEEVTASGLAGRGGAGFPTGPKWRFTRGAPGTPKYVVCNFDESEPGTFKDRALVEGDPFRVLEGILMAGYAIGAAHGYIFVRNEYGQAADVLHEAMAKMRAAGLLGDAILGSGFNFDLTIRRGAGAYICGEETALFEAVEGRRGLPRRKPPYPTTHGLFGQPTSINNVETLALVPDLILNGGHWLRQWGSDQSTGIKLFCLSGDVMQPGVVEAPYGITLRELIERYGGGFKGEPQAIQMGGATGGFLRPDHLDVPLTHEALKPLGLSIGSGAVMVFNRSVSLPAVLRGLAHFFIEETCGQCAPCRIGTQQMFVLLDKISSGEGCPGDLEKLEHLSRTLKRASFCGLGQSAPNPVLSTLKYFRDEYEALLPAPPSGDAAAS